MSKGVKITISVIVGAIVTLGVFDVVMVSLFGVDSTISVVITKYSHTFPIIPFGFGVLMGHFFAQNSRAATP